MTRFPPPTADLFEALGAVVVSFSGLEETLRDELYMLANVECESEGRSVSIMTAKMSFPTLVDSFGAMCRDVGRRPEAGDPVEFCKHLHQLGQDRNTIMHSVWGVRPEGEQRTVQRFKRTAKPKSGFRINPEAMSVDEVWEFVDQLVQAEAKLGEFVPYK